MCTVLLHRGILNIRNKKCKAAPTVLSVSLHSRVALLLRGVWSVAGARFLCEELLNDLFSGSREQTQLSSCAGNTVFLKPCCEVVVGEEPAKGGPGEAGPASIL